MYILLEGESLARHVWGRCEFVQSLSFQFFGRVFALRQNLYRVPGDLCLGMLRQVGKSGREATRVIEVTP